MHVKLQMSLQAGTGFYVAQQNVILFVLSVIYFNANMILDCFTFIGSYNILRRRTDILATPGSARNLHILFVTYTC